MSVPIKEAPTFGRSDRWYSRWTLPKTTDENGNPVNLPNRMNETELMISGLIEYRISSEEK